MHFHLTLQRRNKKFSDTLPEKRFKKREGQTEKIPKRKQPKIKMRRKSLIPSQEMQTFGSSELQCSIKSQPRIIQNIFNLTIKINTDNQ